MPIHAIFFDAAGTLIKTSRPVGESYALMAQKYGMDVVPGELTERFRVCFSSAPPLAFPGARPAEIRQLERQWWKNLVAKIFEPYGRFNAFEDYFAELFEYFSHPDSWSLYQEVEETLSALKKRPLILAVISNFDSRLFGIVEGLGIAPWFEAVIISSQVGYAKPARQIFHHALGMHRLKAEDAIHIGDSPDKDAAGASAAGLKGVLLDRNGKATASPYPRVQNLKEILSLLDRAGELPISKPLRRPRE